MIVANLAASVNACAVASPGALSTASRCPASVSEMTVAASGRSRDERVLAVALVAVLVGVMWAVEIVDLVAGDLDSAGIRPRDGAGLIGVALAPLLHGGFGHLVGNTIPFLVLGTAIALGGLARIATVTVVVAVVGGLGTWLTAPAGTVHIGASGLVFGFATYLAVRGPYTRRALHLATGLVVLGVYGTTLLFGLVPTPGVSWQGHAFGAIGGVIAARLLHREPQRA
jgi:membrane associated rhomboid family serine protease